METNFIAPMALIRAILPSMRVRRRGTIINIFSSAGIEVRASRTLYCASKFALEGFSESLYQEVQPLGIRVLLVEPGAFRTRFGSGVQSPEMQLPKGYQGTIVEKMVEISRDAAEQTRLVMWRRARMQSLRLQRRRV